MSVYRIAKVFDAGQVPDEHLDLVFDTIDDGYMASHTVAVSFSDRERALDAWLIERGCAAGESIVFEIGTYEPPRR